MITMFNYISQIVGRQYCSFTDLLAMLYSGSYNRGYLFPTLKPYPYICFQATQMNK